jgi:hypothetical protein
MTNKREPIRKQRMEETRNMLCAFKIDVEISVGKLSGKFPKLFLNLKNLISSSRTGKVVVNKEFRYQINGKQGRGDC